MTITVGLILHLAIILVGADPAPLAVEWSDRPYGPDGPWNAVRIYAGSSREPIDVHVGMQGETYLLSNTFCNEFKDPAHPCTAQDGGLYETSSSTSSNTDAIETAAVDWASPLSQKGSSKIISDVLAFSKDGAGQTPNSSIGLVDAASTKLSDNISFPVSLGVLSLGYPAINQTYQASKGQVVYNVPTSYLFDQALLPSASFGVHIGSASVGPPGSLYFGGYDRARVFGQIVSQPYSLQGPALTTDLVLLRTKVGPGPSPFAYDSNRTIISTDQGIGAESPVKVELSLDTPYLNLPRNVCDSIAQDLPVSFDENYGLYLWNVSDPQYAKVVNSASWLSFHFPGIGGAVDINVPWMLLNLTLEAPIINTKTQYFPCHPVTANYTLGRAFLQAAFVGVNWRPKQAPGNWFLAQAPGPGIAHMPDVNPILGRADTIGGVNTRWIDTWTDAWAAANSTFASSPPPAPAAGQQPTTELSSGARAGIAVGVVVGVIFALTVVALCLKRQRRKKTDATPAEDAEASQVQQVAVNEYHGGSNRREKRQGSASSNEAVEVQSASIHEVQGTPVHEVYGDVPQPATARETG